MNILIDTLPYEVEVSGQMYEICADFRTSILFETMIQDTTLSDVEKTVYALQLYYPVIPDDYNGAVKKLLWFYNLGKEKKPKANGEGQEDNEEEQEEAPRKQIYSFEYDAEYIYAAFLTQYGVDLVEEDDLHWWKFRAMFRGLEESREFVKIMGYRGAKIDGKMSKEQRKFYREMQRIHALPLPEGEQERQDAITQALMNGGDLTGLL